MQARSGPTQPQVNHDHHPAWISVGAKSLFLRDLLLGGVVGPQGFEPWTNGL